MMMMTSTWPAPLPRPGAANWQGKDLAAPEGTGRTPARSERRKSINVMVKGGWFLVCRQLWCVLILTGHAAEHLLPVNVFMISASSLFIDLLSHTQPTWCPWISYLFTLFSISRHSRLNLAILSAFTLTGVATCIVLWAPGWCRGNGRKSWMLNDGHSTVAISALWGEGPSITFQTNGWGGQIAGGIISIWSETKGHTHT